MKAALGRSKVPQTYCPSVALLTARESAASLLTVLVSVTIQVYAARSSAPET
jgi:hypothetical protein